MESESEYVLGLDLGTASIGWALVDVDKNKIVNMGVRRFEAGVQGDIERGKDESRATARRDARGPRRQNWRRQWRMRKVFRTLQSAGLLPDAADDTAQARHEAMLTLDAELRDEQGIEGRVDSHLLPYILRSKGLDEALSLHALGRAFYHLAQRRGFLSNRKAGGDDDDRGAVKQGISELAEAIEEADCRTIGEYFATLDPEEQRIRKRWTSRFMFLHEFDELWKAQQPHHADILTDEFREKLHDAIFDQRPLKSQSHLIGRCELEPGKKRAPIACLIAQQFRLLQRVNDLKVERVADGSEVEIDADQRAALIEELQTHGDRTWTQTAKALGLKPTKDFTFNFKEGGDKKMVGNRTGAKMFDIMGDDWTALSFEKQTQLVDEIIAFESEEALARRLQTGWGIDDSLSIELAGVIFEPGYGSHSRKAMNRLLPQMEQGIQYATVRKTLYGDRDVELEKLKQLPPFRTLKQFSEVRNPAVERSLSELRKVVNAIVREYGKPREIHVELARDLKHSRKRRKDFIDVRDQNEKSRAEAKKRILSETGEGYATSANILKVRLADECGWICPYSGKQINMNQLVGDEPQFDIEHIVPFSQSLDNSYANKTLCYHETNRTKGNRLPSQAFQGDELDTIIQRVKRFQCDYRLRQQKLARFERTTPLDPEEFASRQLNDTRYLSKKAREYLGCLYGDVIDGEGNTRVLATPGRVTAYLRRQWNLHAVLGSPNKKDRGDHRHHAIDAVVIALTNQGTVQQLSQAAELAEERGLDDLFVEVEQPWEYFLNDVRSHVDAINVSSRVSKKLNGPLHKETIFSEPKPHPTKEETTVHHVRKPLALMSAGDVEAIVDDRVRAKVKEALDTIGLPPAKAFADVENHPHFISKKDPTRIIPIHSARIRKSDHPIAVGKGHRRRYVNPGSNHHMEIVAVLDKEGNEKKWEGILVSRFEAMQRKRQSKEGSTVQIINRNHGDGKVFKFSLTGGEHVMMDTDGEGEQLYRVTVISKNRIEMVLHTDARPDTLRRKLTGARVIVSPNSLRNRKSRKVVVSPLGAINSAND